MSEEPKETEFQNMIKNTETVFLKVDNNAEKNFTFLTEHNFWMVGFEIAADGETYASFVKDKFAIGNLQRIVKNTVEETLKKILKDETFLKELASYLASDE